MKCNSSNSLTALPPFFSFCINFVGYSLSDDEKLQEAWDEYDNVCECGWKEKDNCAHYLSNALIKGGFSELYGEKGANHRDINGFIVCRGGRPIQANQLRDWAIQKWGPPHSSPRIGINFVYQKCTSSCNPDERHVVLKKYRRKFYIFGSPKPVGRRGTGDYPTWEVQEYFYP